MAPASDGSPLEAFAEQMRVLRRECAWKREQTHTSLIPFVREEAEEVVEAITAWMTTCSSRSPSSSQSAA